MHTSEKQKVWMIFDHPQELITALALVSHWGREKYIFNLLISPHYYWQRVDIDLYRHQFDEIIFLERPDYIPSPFPEPRRILGILRRKKKAAQLKGQSGNIAVGRSVLHRLQSFLLYPIHILGMGFRILSVKKKIAQLKIQRSDIIIGFSSIAFVENIVLSMHPENLKIAIMPSRVYEECIRTVDKRIYKNTLEGWLFNWLIEPVTGLYRTYCMKERLHPDLTWWIRYRKSLLDMYDKVVVLGNPTIKTGDNIITMPFPYVLAIKGREDNCSRNKLQKVVFFGTNFMGFTASVIPPEIFAQKLNECFSFLREKYGATCKLVYRPYPDETDERRLLDLSQFEIEEDGMLSELYFYHNFENIHAVFSTESTSSRSALCFYINGYSFLDIFPWDEEMKNYLRLNYGSMPDDFYIKDLSVTPNRYVKTDDMNEQINRCRDVLDKVLGK